MNWKEVLFMEDVQREDSGLPSLSCQPMLFDFLKPVANWMKYSDEKNQKGL